MNDNQNKNQGNMNKLIKIIAIICAILIIGYILLTIGIGISNNSLFR